MYRFRVDDPDVIDVDRIETEWEDQIFDPGDWHLGEKDSGIGREEGLRSLSIMLTNEHLLCGN